MRDVHLPPNAASSGRAVSASGDRRERIVWPCYTSVAISQSETKLQ